MYKLVACDTDSIKICREDGKEMSQQERDSLLKQMNDATPELINLEEDGYYSRFLVIKSKNYVSEKDGKIEFKGSSIKDQKKEAALREMMEKVILALMDNNEKEIHNIYFTYVKEALNITDINRWTVKKTITDKVLEKSDRKNETTVRDALGDDHFQEGDKVWVYQAIDGLKQKVVKDKPVFLKNGEPKMEENNILKQVKNWSGDQDQWHYVKRVYKTLEIFSNVLDTSNFINYSNKKNRSLVSE